MASAIKDRKIGYSSTTSISSKFKSIDRQPKITDIDWSGHHKFKELGQLIKVYSIRGVENVINLGVYTDTDLSSTFFAASSRPHAIGSGVSIQEAIVDWLTEVDDLRNQAKMLRGPIGPATENDIEALTLFFGTL